MRDSHAPDRRVQLDRINDYIGLVLSFIVVFVTSFKEICRFWRFAIDDSYQSRDAAGNDVIKSLDDSLREEILLGTPLLLKQFFHVFELVNEQAFISVSGNNQYVAVDGWKVTNLKIINHVSFGHLFHDIALAILQIHSCDFSF